MTNKSRKGKVRAWWLRNWNVVLGGLVICLYLLLPGSLVSEINDLNAFLNRATSRAPGTTHNSVSSYSPGSNAGGSMPISSSSCEEDVTFLTNKTQRSITFHASDAVNFQSLPCSQDQVIVLYNPRAPADARIAEDIPLELRDDTLELVLSLIPFGIALVPLLLALIFAIPRWLGLQRR